MEEGDLQYVMDRWLAEFEEVAVETYESAECFLHWINSCEPSVTLMCLRRM